ncbi:MAG: TIGR03617 family F420-dependent LLM class oxidoreductase [Proteobacteria bacterium]|nr:TIGR03617 family F420-dependent LLM class oxidoreductase [Pseudomonadota bacterium]
MKLGTGVGGWLAGIEAAARKAEQAGYDYVSCGELAHDSILTMTLAAAATDTVELQTSVTIAFPRSPFVLAQEAWDLQAYSKGRFTLGLGSQVKGHNERRFSIPWSAPAPRMREYIMMMHAVWDSWQDGKSADFLGKHYRYTLMTPNFNPGPIEYPRPKVALAVVGAGMARVAGEMADVILPHGGIMTDRYMREVLLPNVKIGLDRAGRTWQDVEIAASGYLVMGKDEREIAQNLNRQRQALSFYGSTRTYHEVLRMHGLEALGHKLHQLSLRGAWQEMREVITEDDLRALCQTCTYDEYPQFIKEHREYASLMGFGMPTRTVEEQERAMALMAALRAIENPGVPGEMGSVRSR